MPELTYRINSTQDTYWGSGAFQSGQHNSSFLYTGQLGTGVFTSVIDFSQTVVQDFLNLDNVSSTDNIVKVELFLYLTSNSQSGVSNPLLAAKRITSAWLESTANFFNQPTTTDTDSFILLDKPTGSSNKLSKFDITEIAKGWINGDYNCYGLEIEGTARNTNSFTRFQSSGASNSQYRPRLVITYTEDEPEPPPDPDPDPDMEQTYTLTATQDTFHGSSGDSIFGFPSADYFTFGSNLANSFIAFIDFSQSAVQNFLNLDNVTSTNNIIKAELFINLTTNPQADKTPQNNRIARITTEWFDNLLTYLNVPTITSIKTIPDFNPVGEANKLTKIDITSWVKGWINGDYPCYGVSLLNPIADEPNSAVSFKSIENENVSERPRLVITYTHIPTPEQITNLNVTSLGLNFVTLSWDNPNNDTITGYQYRTHQNGVWENVPDSSNTTTSYTLTNLFANTQYVIRMRAVNVTGGGPEATITVVTNSSYTKTTKSMEYKILNAEIPVVLPPSQIPNPVIPHGRQLHYRVQTPDTVEKSLEYKVLSIHQETKQLDYATKKETNIEKGLSYSVVFAGDIQKRDDYYKTNSV